MMRPHSLLVVLVAAAFLPAVAQSPQPTPTTTPAPKVRQVIPQTAPSFTAKAQGFALWLPVKPVSDRQVTRMGNGETATTFIFKADTQPVTYLVIATPVTPSVNVSDPIGQLDAFQEGLRNTFVTKSPGANLQKREELQLGAFRGRELKFSLLKGHSTSRTRVYFTPRFFYQLFAGGEKGSMQKSNTQIDRVFDSFRILPQP